jgi:hypothetical protein
VRNVVVLETTNYVNYIFENKCILEVTGLKLCNPIACRDRLFHSFPQSFQGSATLVITFN